MIIQIKIRINKLIVLITKNIKQYQILKWINHLLWSINNVKNYTLQIGAFPSKNNNDFALSFALSTLGLT